MSARTLYGVETHTLEEILNTFMVMSGNSRRSHFADYMITAGDVWKRLFRSTIWNLKQMVLDVSDDDTVMLPAGVERFMGLSVIDFKGDLQPLINDPNINTLKVTCHPKKCSCKNCNGEDSLCDAIDSITMRTEPIIIDTVTYYKRIWNKKEGCNIMQVTEIPVKQGDTLTTITENVLICSVEVDDRGCIKPTAPNRDTLRRYCGCYIPSCHYQMCNDHHRSIRPTDPPNFSYYGFYKEDALCEQKIHLRHVKAKKVILSYQEDPKSFLNGDTIVVPDYAKDAMLYGINHYTGIFVKSISRGDKIAAEQDYLKERRKLFLYMHPISLEEFSRLPSRTITW